MAKLVCILTVIAFAAIGTYADEPERLVNGVDTTINQYPHAISIQLREGNRHICGGSILNERYIITAAHCVEPFKKDPDGIEKIVIVTGTTTLDKNGQKHEIEKMYYHNKYKTIPHMRSSGFDVGLMKLKEDIVFSDVQKPIELSECNMKQGDTVTIVAWGTIRFKGPVSNVLQKIDAKYLQQETCQKYHLQRITKEEFCSFVGVGTGMCQGDSGSCVIHDGKIVGVVSGGRPCARGIPDIHTNLCSHKEWIEDTMKN